MTLTQTSSRIGECPLVDSAPASSVPDFRGSVLAQLPPRAARALAECAVVSTADKLTVMDRGTAIFPVSGMLSIRKAGYGVEVGSVGPEGGMCIHIDDDYEVVAQTPLTYVAVSLNYLKAAAIDHAPIAALKKECDRWLFHQAMQIAFCNASHDVTQRTFRWLLRAADCTRRIEIPVMHWDIATALGSNRTVVTLALKLLGGTKHQRARVTVDRAVMRKHACDCCEAFGPRAWPQIGAGKR